MAKELFLPLGQTGLTVYAMVRDSQSRVWNGAGFVTAAPTDNASYVITLTEEGTTGNYLADFPTGIVTAGRYAIDVRRRAGTAPAWTDPPVGQGMIDWSGSAVAIPTIPDAQGRVTVGTNADKAGYLLASAGLDAIQVEAGVNVRQALSPILAATAGVLSGAETGTIVIQGGNVAVTRITATTDSVGNRTSVVLSLPA